MVDKQLQDPTKLAGFSQVLRAQASSLLGQAEALIGLTNEDEFLQKSVKELTTIENNEVVAKSPDEFTKANLRI